MFIELQKHQHKLHKLVLQTIKRAAIPFDTKIENPTQAFKNGHVTLTIDFWKIINAEHPNKFNRVDFCHGCRKFNLY